MDPRRLSQLLLLLLTATPAAALQEDLRPRLFRVPLDADAEVRADNVLRFAGLENWARAVEELQVLFDDHRGAVLPERFARGKTSQYDLHPGAATWALHTLSELPSVARDRYRERFGPEADTAFAEARARADRKSLTEVARRFALTDAGVRAWFALGDLELELGNRSAALAAWEQARELLDTLGAGAPAGAEARWRAAEALADADDDETDRWLRGGLALSGTGEGSGPVPQGNADHWVETELDFSPFHGTGRSERYNLFPVLAGDSLLVSSTLQLFCLDAFSSELRWASEPPDGWSNLADWKRNELFAAIDKELCLVAPAAGSGICVAPLQVPYANQEDHDYQGIEILKAIPERRLFAFDLATGEELWNHAPPLGWDGETGRYEERMLVAAPPTIRGSRVIVPCYRMAGRIDFQVACYDLRTGERLWSTGLVSGQRELNMFGRQTQEFCGAPVTVEGDGVYVLTQLGTIARLDLFSGRILWESRYEQIKIPKNRGWTTSDRDVVWRNAPPVVTDDVVVATPHDSYLLVGVDREDGTVLWSYDYDRLPVTPDLADDDPTYGVLLGADGDTVYLGGKAVSALQKQGGLHFQASARRGLRHDAFKARWSVAITGYFSRLPRPVVGAEEVVIPTYDERLVVSKRTGDRIASKTAGWGDRERGNALIGKGLLVTIGNRKLSAFFDWELLLDRAKRDLAERPDDVGTRVSYSGLLLRRAQSYQAEGRPERAQPLLRQAREVLEGVLYGPGGAASGQRNGQVAESLYRVLREQAYALKLEADGPGALKVLDEALTLASSAEDIRDTLLLQEELLRRREPKRWRAVLGELETRCGGLSMPAERLAEDVDWLVGESLLVLVPGDLQRADVPVGLWVLLSRADASARERRHGDALEDLHTALARYGARPLAYDLSISDVATARIARRLELDGRSPYAPFEERARALFERAVEAKDPALLAEVERLYPHAKAAERSADLGLAWALESGDPAASAALAYRSFSNEPTPTPDDAHVLVRLGQVLSEAGNDELGRALLSHLGTELGDRASDLPAHGGKTFAEVARTLGANATSAPLPQPTFGEGLQRMGTFEGRHEVVGEVLERTNTAERAPASVLVLSERFRGANAGPRLMALSSDDPLHERWSHELSFRFSEENVALQPGRVLVGGEESVVALGSDQGEVAWTFEASGEEVKSVSASSGMAIVLTELEDPATGRVSERIRALDAHSGLLLWTISAGETAGWTRPVCGEGKAVFLRPLWSSSSVALVVDLFRGRILNEIDLGDAVLVDSWRGAWVEDGQVVVPFFSTSRNGESRVQSFDLVSGKPRWTLPFGEGQELSGIATLERDNYLVVLPVATARGGDAGEVLKLDTRTGRGRRVASLKGGEDTMGLPRKERTRLAEPFLFTYQVRPGARTIPIKMIPLDSTPGWIYHLQVTYDELYNDGLPRPAVSGDLVAVAYSTKNRSNLSRDETHLELVDKTGGFRRASMLLSPQMSKSHVKLYGLGSSLLAVGAGRLGSRDISRLEVLETVR
ncbi:MAG: PQQ-binding-like beta-propeller repeat protein [Planctomycetota bacterium]